jgi:hypothetical protein
MALANQPPTPLRHTGQEQATSIREAGGGFVFDGTLAAVGLLPGAVRLPLVKDRDRDTGQGVGQAAPPPSLKVPVAAIKADQLMCKKAGL